MEINEQNETLNKQNQALFSKLFLNIVDHRRFEELSEDEIVKKVSEWRNNGYGKLPTEDFKFAISFAISYGTHFENRETWRKVLYTIEDSKEN